VTHKKTQQNYHEMSYPGTVSVKVFVQDPEKWNYEEGLMTFKKADVEVYKTNVANRHESANWAIMMELAMAYYRHICKVLAWKLSISEKNKDTIVQATTELAEVTFIVFFRKICLSICSFVYFLEMSFLKDSDL
jgi:hypothetical protein